MPSTIVATRNSISSFRSPVCAAWTASAIVRLLVMRTTVLIAPSVMSSEWLAAANASGYQAAVDRVGDEQAAEEQHFGDQKHPHAEGRRVLLLLEVVEVMRERRMVPAAP